MRLHRAVSLPQHDFLAYISDRSNAEITHYAFVTVSDVSTVQAHPRSLIVVPMKARMCDSFPYADRETIEVPNGMPTG